jgi:hypothetical protein
MGQKTVATNAEGLFKELFGIGAGARAALNGADAKKVHEYVARRTEAVRSARVNTHSRSRGRR